MTTDWFADLVARQRACAGALGDHISTFATLLVDRGYAEATTKEHVRLVADFGRWVARKGSVSDIDERWVPAFITNRRRRGFTTRSYATGLRMLLGMLRDAGVARPLSGVATESGVNQMVEIERAFTCYLVEERGLVESTRNRYVDVIRRFLRQRFHHRRVDLAKLCGEDVSEFVLLEVRTRQKSMPVIVPALRIFLRWAHQRGETERSLAGCVPAVASSPLATLPKSLPPEQIELLLCHCDRSIPIGRRDYAILLLLVRLGLRAGEIVAMELGDLDWERGEVVVRGKGGRQDRLPLPRDVGAALAAYLRRGRPECSTRRVFVRARAPHRGFISSVAVSNIVHRGLRRAGLAPSRKGAHTLRHALACSMLRRGASLTQIGQILRHRSPDTTAIYAKVDIGSLRKLALAWPAGGDA